MYAHMFKVLRIGKKWVFLWMCCVCVCVFVCVCVLGEGMCV